MDRDIMDMVAGIPERLKDARFRRGLTQDDVAQRLNVSRSLISQYESGKTMVSVEHLLKLARILDESAVTLMGLSVRSISSFPPSIVEVAEMMEHLCPEDRNVVLRLVKGLTKE
jgi:transcriptional regulator with XRE-family HTH domain